MTENTSTFTFIVTLSSARSESDIDERTEEEILESKKRTLSREIRANQEWIEEMNKTMEEREIKKRTAKRAREDALNEAEENYKKYQKIKRKNIEMKEAIEGTTKESEHLTRKMKDVSKKIEDISRKIEEIPRMMKQENNCDE